MVIRHPKDPNDCLNNCSERGVCKENYCKCEKDTMGNYCQYETSTPRIDSKNTFEIKAKSSIFLLKPFIPPSQLAKLELKYRFRCENRKQDLGFSYEPGALGGEDSEGKLEIYRNIQLLENKDPSVMIHFMLPNGLSNTLKKSLDCEKPSGAIEISRQIQDTDGSEYFAIYNPNFYSKKFTLMFSEIQLFPSSETEYGIDDYNKYEVGRHSEELRKFKIERSKQKEDEIKEKIKKKEEEFRNGKSEDNKKGDSSKYVSDYTRGNNEHYTDVINVIFIFIFSLVLILAILLVIIISCKVCYSFVSRNTRLRNALIRRSEFPTINRNLLNENIPKRKLLEDYGKYGDNTCTICMMEIGSDEYVREISSCLHLFHSECIERWLKVKELCPLCKTGLSKYDLAPDVYGRDPNIEENDPIQGIEIQELPPFLDNDDIRMEDMMLGIRNFNNPLNPRTPERPETPETERDDHSDYDFDTDEDEEEIERITREVGQNRPRIRRTLNETDLAGIERNIIRMNNRINDLTTQINDLSSQVSNRQRILDTMDENNPEDLRVMDLLSREIEIRTQEIDDIINNEINLQEIHQDLN